MTDGPIPLWVPAADALETTAMGRFISWLGTERGLTFEGYDDLWRWSVEDLGAFWSSVQSPFCSMVCSRLT